MGRLLLGLAACSSTACGGDTEPTVGDHYALSEPAVIIDYRRSSVATTYLVMLGLDLEWPRAKHIEYTDDNLEEPIESWLTDLDEATKNEGKALLTEELVAKYEADSVPFGEENESPHCRINIALPPSVNNRYTIRLSEDDTWSPETQALLDYLFGVYDQYAPEP